MANNTYFDTNAIGKKLFAYVSTYTQFNSDKVQTLLDSQFKNSLIVIGDEGRMYSPATKTYIGIGNTAYQNTINMIENVDDKVDALNQALTASLVSGIYVNKSKEDIIKWNTEKGTNFTNVFATNDILIKGIGDYDKTTGLSYGYQWSHIEDANNDGVETVYSYIAPKDRPRFATSGITVKLDKGANIYRFAYYVDNGEIKKVAEGAEGKWIASTKAPTPGRDELTGYKVLRYPDETNGVTYIAAEDSAGNPIFKNGSNVISIDDEMTWAYISASNTYALNFAKDFTKSEVNRIYAEILGYGQDTIIPVSKGQVLDVVVNGKQGEENGVKLNDKTVFFVKCPIKAPAGKTVIANTNKEYAEDRTEIKGETYSVTREVTVVNPFKSDTEAETKTVTPAYWTAAKALTTDEPIDGTKYYFAYEAGEFYQSDYVLKPITAADIENNQLDPLDIAEFVVINPSIAEVDNINISDGIQTLKEVAHILDVITNGNYDSQDPEAAGIELAYSIAQNHIDILDLDARVDKIEAGTDTVKSLKEGPNGDYVDLTITGLDTDTPGAYAEHVTISADLAIAYTYTTPDSQFETGTYVSSIVVAADTKVPSLDTTSGADITYAADTHRQGLADVAWTTAYVSDARKSITEEITAATYSAYQYSYGLVNSLNSSDAVDTGYFVSGVSIVDGKIDVTATHLPTDKVVVNTTVWGEDTGELKEYQQVDAGQIATRIDECAKLYKKDGTTFVKATTGEVTTVDNKVTVGGKQAYKLDGDAKFVEIPGELDNQVRNSLSKGKAYTEYIPVYVSADKYSLIDIEDIVSGKYTGDVYELKAQPTEAKKYISAETTHNIDVNDKNTGENTLHLTAHITKIEDASATNTGLVDAYDVKQVIDNIFEWVDLSKWAK